MDNKAFQNIQKKLALTNEGISETMDVELFTVRQWASGIWPVPRPIVKFLRTLLSMKRDNEAIYMSGYGKGHRGGYEKGNADGYTIGYAEGFGKGFDAALRT